MRLLQACLLLVIVCKIPAQQRSSSVDLPRVKPGALLSISTERLGQIRAAHSMLVSLPVTFNIKWHRIVNIIWHICRKQGPS